MKTTSILIFLVAVSAFAAIMSISIDIVVLPNYEMIAPEFCPKL